MNIKTEEGIAEGMPLTDIQQNNNILRNLIILIGIFGSLTLIYLIWLTYYVISNNVLNNIVAMCL